MRFITLIIWKFLVVDALFLIIIFVFTSSCYITLGAQLPANIIENHEYDVQYCEQ